MARKRMIDPAIWTDRRFAKLSEGEQLTFIAIFSQADDEGRLEWNAFEFKLRCFPASALSENVFENRKNILAESGLAYEYTLNGRAYLLLPGWFKTQKLERGAISKIADPEDLSTNPALSDYFESLKIVREWHESRVKSSDRQKMSENGTERPLEEKRREGKRKEKKAVGAEAPAPPTFGDSEADVCVFIANVAAENKTGKISPSRETSVRLELADLAGEFGESVFRDALRETNIKGVPNLNYVRRVAESAQRRGNVTPLRPTASDFGIPADRIF